MLFNGFKESDFDIGHSDGIEVEGEGEGEGEGMAMVEVEEVK